jgi:Rod binding domain-containing protein
MAINPPSDIVLDVLKAADPARLAVAEQRLNALRASDAAPPDFAASLDQAASAMNGAGADARNRLQSVGATDSKMARQKVEFEAMILNNLVTEIIPKSSDSMFGKGFAGDMWRSMLADQIAHQIARAGTLGIAKRLFASHPVGGAQAYGVTGADSAAPSRMKTSEAASVSGASAGGLTAPARQDEAG